MQDVLSDGGVGDHAHRLDSDIHPPQSVVFHNDIFGYPLDFYSAGAPGGPGAKGNGPGGGGGGGLPDRFGGDGHDGKVWIIAYFAAVTGASWYHGLSHAFSSKNHASIARYTHRFSVSCKVRTGLPLILDHGLLSQTSVGVVGGGIPGSVAPVSVGGGRP
jgi:hypothetical protein